MGADTVIVTEPDIEQARFSIKFAIERANGNQEALIENLVQTIAAKNAAIRQLYAILHKPLTDIPMPEYNTPDEEDANYVCITSGRVDAGDIVRTVTGHDWEHAGLEGDRARAHKHLQPGTEYVVDGVEVGSWHTDVYLKDFPNIAFNSVLFEDEVRVGE